MQHTRDRRPTAHFVCPSDRVTHRGYLLYLFVTDACDHRVVCFVRLPCLNWNQSLGIFLRQTTGDQSTRWTGFGVPFHSHIFAKTHRPGKVISWGFIRRGYSWHTVSDLGAISEIDQVANSELEIFIPHDADAFGGLENIVLMILDSKSFFPGFWSHFRWDGCALQLTGPNG